MSEIKFGQTQTQRKVAMRQRRKDAISRRNSEGYKLHGATPGSIEERTQDILRDSGVLDDNNRLSATARPDRNRSHNIGETVNLKKRLVAGAAATAIVFGGAALAGKIAPDGGEPPFPGNMTEFDQDPLQEDYRLDPAGHTVVGGEIVKTGADQANDLVDSGALDAGVNEQMRASSQLPPNPEA